MKYTPASEQIVSKLMDGEAIVINLSSGVYYSMESTAAKIWRDLCAGEELSALIADAQSAYPNDTQAPAQIETFVTQLVADGLLAEAGGAAPEAEVLEDVAWPTTFSAPQLESFDDVAEMVSLDPPLPELQSYASGH